MNIGTIVTPMTRGQITLPKAYRDKLGISSATPLNITLEGDKIVVQPLTKVISDQSPYVIKPRYAKEEYRKVLKRVTQYMKKHGPLWTKEDDVALARMRAKEKRWDW